MRKFSDSLANLGRDARRPLPRLVIAVSGPIGAGKTTLAKSLATQLNGSLVKTSEVLEHEYGADPHVRGRRRKLQELGEQLDVQTGGEWVASAVQRVHKQLGGYRPLVVDALRIPEQLERLRAERSFRVILIYLSAFPATLERRYPAGEKAELPTYADVLRNNTERNIGRMAALTRLRLDTDSRNEEGVLAAALTGIGWRKLWWTVSSWPIRVLVGAIVCSPFFTPIIWFLWSWTASGVLLFALRLVFVLLALVISWLIGTTLVGPSPLESDT